MLTLKVAQPFQDVPDPSTEFDLRLLEIIAVSIHNLAIHIFKECHPNGGPHEENMGPKAVPALEHPHTTAIHNIQTKLSSRSGTSRKP